MKRVVLAATVAVAASLSISAFAQTSTAPAQSDPVVATVDGQNIHASEVFRLYQSLPAQYRQQAPLGQLAPQLIDRLIDQKLVAKVARASGIGETEAVKREIESITDNVLQEAYLNQEITAAITDTKLKEAYKAKIKDTPTKDEIRASHILLKTEAKAKEVIADLKANPDFAAAAKKHSTGPTASRGGDLGFFPQGAMVPEFDKAVFAMKTGEITQTPVKTQFGWHVIKLEERRKGEAPSFDQMVPELRRDLSRQTYQDIVAGLRTKAKITKNDMAPNPAAK